MVVIVPYRMISGRPWITGDLGLWKCDLTRKSTEDLCKGNLSWLDICKTLNIQSYCWKCLSFSSKVQMLVKTMGALTEKSAWLIPGTFLCSHNMGRPWTFLMYSTSTTDPALYTMTLSRRWPYILPPSWEEKKKKKIWTSILVPYYRRTTTRWAGSANERVKCTLPNSLSQCDTADSCDCHSSLQGFMPSFCSSSAT